MGRIRKQIIMITDLEKDIRIPCLLQIHLITTACPSRTLFWAEFRDTDQPAVKAAQIGNLIHIVDFRPSDSKEEWRMGGYDHLFSAPHFQAYPGQPPSGLPDGYHKQNAPCPSAQ